MKLLASLFVAMALGSVTPPAAAQPATGTPMLTRLVKVFSELETQLAGAARKGDQAELSKLLDASFETRSASAPGTPLPRAEWISAAKSSDATARMEQMAVQDLDTVAIVSFKRSSLFIVDVWTQHGGEWMLRSRYSSPAS